jgi:hypothetical protein
MPKKKSAGQDAAKSQGTPAKKTRKRIAAESAAANEPAPQPAAAQPGKDLIAIDYPMEGEIVVSPTYTVRVTAAEPRYVEVSLDEKQWFPTRESNGHWWYDWSGYQAGAYAMTARMRDRNGNAVKTKARQFTVLI